VALKTAVTATSQRKHCARQYQGGWCAKHYYYFGSEYLLSTFCLSTSQLVFIVIPKLPSYFGSILSFPESTPVHNEKGYLRNQIWHHADPSTQRHSGVGGMKGKKYTVIQGCHAPWPNFGRGGGGDAGRCTGCFACLRWVRVPR